MFLMIGRKCGEVARHGVVPRRLLGRSRLPACLPWARFGGGGGAVLSGLSAARGAVCTGGAPAAVGRGAGGVVAWAVMLVRVGVSALRLWAEWQGQDDTLWLASTNRHRTHWQLWIPLP